MPSPLALELAADERVVAHPRQGIGFGHRIHVHAVLRQIHREPEPPRVPEQTRGTDQRHRRGFLESRAPFIEQIDDLPRLRSLPPWHD
jgi:hypothetical protein